MYAASTRGFIPESMYITDGCDGSTAIEFCAELPTAHVAKAALACVADVATDIPTTSESPNNVEAPMEINFLIVVSGAGKEFIAIFRWSGRAPSALFPLPIVRLG